MAIHPILRLYETGHARFPDGLVTFSLQGQVATEPNNLKRGHSTKALWKHAAVWRTTLEGIPSTISLFVIGKKQDSNLDFPDVTYSTRNTLFTMQLVTSQNGMQQKAGYLTTL